MSDFPINRLLRAMSWQRAKGELRAMLETFYNEQDQFVKLNKVLQKFFKDVEDNGLQE